jgi:hypothetical protein
VQSSVQRLGHPTTVCPGFARTLPSPLEGGPSNSNQLNQHALIDRWRVGKESFLLTSICMSKGIPQLSPFPF